MKDLFIPYELAVIAKEKGFNEPVISWWDGHDLLTFSASEEGIEINNTGFLARPLCVQLIDWFRNKHQIKFIETERDFQVPAFYLVKNSAKIAKGRISKTSPATINSAIKVAFNLI